MTFRGLQRMPDPIEVPAPQQKKGFFQKTLEWMQLTHAWLRWLLGTLIFLLLAPILWFLLYAACRLSHRGTQELDRWLQGGL